MGMAQPIHDQVPGHLQDQKLPRNRSLKYDMERQVIMEEAINVGENGKASRSRLRTN